MPAIDKHAAALIRELRVDRGLTPEGLSYEIHKHAPGHPVSGRTVRRIEYSGSIPSVRVMFGIAAAFDRTPSEIWTLKSRRKVAV